MLLADNKIHVGVPATHLHIGYVLMFIAITYIAATYVERWAAEGRTKPKRIGGWVPRRTHIPDIEPQVVEFYAPPPDNSMSDHTWPWVVNPGSKTVHDRDCHHAKEDARPLWTNYHEEVRMWAEDDGLVPCKTCHPFGEGSDDVVQEEAPARD